MNKQNRTYTRTRNVDPGFVAHSMHDLASLTANYAKALESGALKETYLQGIAIQWTPGQEPEYRAVITIDGDTDFGAKTLAEPGGTVVDSWGELTPEEFARIKGSEIESLRFNIAGYEKTFGPDNKGASYSGYLMKKIRLAELEGREVSVEQRAEAVRYGLAEMLGVPPEEFGDVPSFSDEAEEGDRDSVLPDEEEPVSASAKSEAGIGDEPYSGEAREAKESCGKGTCDAGLEWTKSGHIPR